MRLLITIQLLVLFVEVQGQQVKEDFINHIDTAFVDKTTKTYYLSDRMADFFIVEQLTPFLKDDLKTVISDSTADYLLDAANKKAEVAFWQKDIIKSAVLINRSQIDTLLGSVLTVRKYNESKSAAKKKDKLLKSKRATVYFFSQPIFDKKGQYALIQMGYACGNSCGYQCIYLFRLVKGSWEQILKTSCLMS
jgi:hypothetical protein